MNAVHAFLLSTKRGAQVSALLLVSAISLSTLAEESTDSRANFLPASIPASYREIKSDDGLPEYTFPYDNGLYATIAGYMSVKDVSVKHLEGYDLKVGSFEKKIPVKAVIQKHRAPLAVVLLGISGLADADFSKLWVSWYAKAGYHVLVFDSTFRPEFVNISGHGVSGNLWKESERVAEIIQSFTQMKEIRGKIDQIGVVGMSYGGTQALILGSLSREGKLPFEISAVQAYSPPIRFEKSAEIIDRWYNVERSKFTLTELKEKFAGHTPTRKEGKCPFTESEMRAAFSASFRLGLPDVIVRNDDYFKLNILPHGNEFDDQYVRRDAAEKWGYTRFAFDMAVPFWEERLGRDALNTLIHQTALPQLLQKQPPYSETIMADDDPLNDPDDLKLLKSHINSVRLTLLPRGGHLGYVAEPWTKAKLLSLFKSQDNGISYGR